MLLLLAGAFASEGCVDPFAISGSWMVGEVEMTLHDGILKTPDRVLGTEVIEMPSVAGERVVFVTRRPDSMLTDLYAWDATDGRPHLLVGGEDPMQAVISPDGRRVAYVSGITSISAIYIVDFGGGYPEQLTNTELVRVPGRAPIGFVESPSQGMVFEGDALVWEGASQTHRLPLTGGAK